MPTKRSRARKRNTWIIFLLLTVIFLLAGFAGVLLLRLDRVSGESLPGQWVMQLDLTDHARTAANFWLQEAELGEQIDAGEALPKLEVPVLLTLQRDGRWSRRLDSAAYEKAEAAASKALAQSLRALLLLRMEDAGRRPEKAAETVFENAVGMPMEEYLRQYGPRLLPELSELEARYTGSGSYERTASHLVFDGTGRFAFLTDGRTLLLTGDGGTEVYARG